MASVAETAFSTIPPTLRPVAEAARDEVLRRVPDLAEEIKWGNLCFRGRDFVVSLIAHKEHVNLQFWRGMDIDPEGRWLTGTGKNLRHAKLRSVEDARREDLMALVEKAAALDGKDAA